MKTIACLGSEQFILGFQLTGIRQTIKADENNFLDKVHEIKMKKEIGIVIVDEKLMEKLDSHDRTDIEDSVEPVFITLSTQASSDNIRKLIIKSIGVDLWKGE